MRAILDEEKLLSYEEALKIFITHTSPSPLGIEEVSLVEALGRVSAETIYSPINLPPFSRSTVDGYALIHTNTPGKFKVIGKINIGEYKVTRINNFEAIEVDTGALIPENSTAVIKVEETRKEGEEIIVNKSVKFGENIGWIGSDIPVGTEIIRKGEVISPEKIALLASVGINKVKVFKKPRIFIITTGNELIEPGNPLVPGKIYESNSYYLMAKLKAEGCEIVGSIHVNDDKEAIRKALLEAIEKADLVIMTGGTSAGERDFVHQVIREEGEIIVHGIKFKPGKPTILGKVKNKPVIGLPGNIVSTIMVTEKVISNYLALISGKEVSENIKIKAVLMNNVKGDKNRFTYVPVFLFRKKDEENYFALSVPFDSYMIGTFASADGYIQINPGEELKEGQEINVYIKRFDNRPVYIGEEEPRIIEKLKDEFRILPLGSFPALKALKYGVGDVIVVSKLYETNVSSDFIFRRKILENGSGDAIGYYEWIGLSKLVSSPSVKLRYISIAKNFIGKAKVILPETMIKEGKVIYEEELDIIVNDKFKPKLKTVLT